MKTEFEHKYEIGDHVWMMLADKPYETSVNGLKFAKYQKSISIKYNLANGQCDVDVVRLFPSKEELIKSL